MEQSIKTDHRRARPWATLLTVLVFAVSACGSASSDDAAADTTDPIAETETGSTTESETTTTTEAIESETTVETEPAVEQPDDGLTLVKASVVEGSVTSDEERFEVELGSEVTIEVTSDAVDHLHLHGYDMLADISPDEPATVTFTADIPGVFEVELEESGLFLFEIAVR